MAQKTSQSKNSNEASKRGSRTAGKASPSTKATATRKASTPAKTKSAPPAVAASNNPAPKRGSRSVEPKPNIAHDLIAAKAYQLWQGRGGSQEENWFEAERLLRDQTV